MHKEAHFSRVGYILAMAGSAIGLGTAWKFPTMVGLGGGFAFILVYLVLCLAIGAAAFLAEALLGRATGRDTVGAIYELAPSAKRVWSIGGFFVFVSIMIVPFYLVVVGWIFYYAMLCMSQLPTDPASAKEAFGYLASNNIFGVSMGFLIVFALSIYTILKG
ncbi:MAG: sodium-dependent transporter, partial [Campylobacter sp.]|nr:sodium-dependent transporter [Campylobacter sp.]